LLQCQPMKTLLAEEVASARLALGWTQAELATRAGLSRQTVNEIEAGSTCSSVPTLRKLAKALKLDPYKIVTSAIFSIVRRTP
jgi:putative transcriptional regulator